MAADLFDVAAVLSVVAVMSGGFAPVAYDAWGMLGRVVDGVVAVVTIMVVFVGGGRHPPCCCCLAAVIRVLRLVVVLLVMVAVVAVPVVRCYRS